MNHNYYVQPFDDAFTIRAVYNKTIGDDLALSQWQARFGHDRLSKSSPIAYKDYTVQRIEATKRVDSPFDRNGDDWGYWSPYDNGRASWDNTNRLDNGSLRVDFATATGARDSHVLVYRSLPPVARLKGYLLRFDAVASAIKKVEVFIRQRNAPFGDVTRRYTVLVSPVRKQYELAFTASADEANALLTFQTNEDGQVLWLDNVRLQDAIITRVNPDDYVRLVYNPSPKDSLIGLPGNYRDVKNRYWGSRLTLKPFSSAVLLKDSLPPVDVRLSLQANQKLIRTGQIATVSLRLTNESTNRGLTGNRVQWNCRLPANLTLVDASGQPSGDSLLTGTVGHLTTDTTFVFRVRSAAEGTYAVAAEVTASTYGDPDSTPDSGLGDGEDDTALFSIVVNNQLPTATTTPDGTDADGQAGNVPAEAAVVFPNPAVGEFTFVARRAVQHLTVVDLLGRQRLLLGATPQNRPVRFGEQLPAGPYLLHILYGDGERRTIRLLKTGR